MVTEKKGMMFVLSSPSGAGKTTLTKKIAKNNTGFSISISHTTRKPRPNEINGKDYHFVSREEFNDLAKGKNFFATKDTANSTFITSNFIHLSGKYCFKVFHIWGSAGGAAVPNLIS